MGIIDKYMCCNFIHIRSIRKYCMSLVDIYYRCASCSEIAVHKGFNTRNEYICA